MQRILRALVEQSLFDLPSPSKSPRLEEKQRLAEPSL
jgi:hypothetical protein